MAWNGAGTYNLPSTTVTPATSGSVIESGAFNTFTADLKTAISLCITGDGVNHVVTANLPMSTYLHTGVGDGTALQTYASVNQVVDGVLTHCATDSAVGTDAYAVDLAINPVTLIEGAKYSFTPDVDNTGACSVDFSSIGAKNIKLADGTDPYTGAIQANAPCTVQYDGTSMILQNPSPETYSYGVATLGTAEASKVLTLDASADLNMANVGRIDNCETVQFNSEVDNGNSGATKTITLDSGQKQKVTVSEATTLTLANPTSVGNWVLKIVNGTAFAITWAASSGSVLWSDGLEPTWSASGTDLMFIYYDGTNFYCAGSVGFA